MFIDWQRKQSHFFLSSDTQKHDTLLCVVFFLFQNCHRRCSVFSIMARTEDKFSVGLVFVLYMSWISHWLSSRRFLLFFVLIWLSCRRRRMPSCTFRRLDRMPSKRGTRRPTPRWSWWGCDENTWQTDGMSRDGGKLPRRYTRESRRPLFSPARRNIKSFDIACLTNSTSNAQLHVRN